MHAPSSAARPTRLRSARSRGRLLRRGISLLEVVTALTILGTALIGMAEHGRRYARSNANSMLLNNALDMASGQVERVKALLQKHPTLVSELSYRPGLTEREGRLSPP